MDPKDGMKLVPHPELIKTLLEVPLDQAQPDRTMKIGSALLESSRVELINFLRANAKIFAWSPRDMAWDGLRCSLAPFVHLFRGLTNQI